MPRSTERFCASQIIDWLFVARTGATFLWFQRLRLLMRRKWSVEGLALALATLYLLLGALLSPQSTVAEPLPANRLVTSSLVSPSAAWARFGTSVAHTAGLAATTTTPPDIIALARGLGSGRSEISATQYARNVFNYIRNNIDTEFRVGLGKGGRRALIDQSGTLTCSPEM